MSEEQQRKKGVSLNLKIFDQMKWLYTKKN